MKDISEKELLQKLAKGDQYSFGILFNTYHLRLYHFVLHYLNDEESAKDIVQDIFSVAWEDRTKFTDVKNLSSWLFTIAKNLCLKKIDHLKVKQKHSDHLKFRHLETVQGALNELDTSPLLFNEISKIVQQTLEQLSPQSRRIFELNRFENRTYSNIAEELNISQKTVEAHISKSLKLFRKALRNYLPLIAFLLQ